MAGKHEGLKNEINRGYTEKAQDAILMTSSHRQKCLWPGLSLHDFGSVTRIAFKYKITGFRINFFQK